MIMTPNIIGYHTNSPEKCIDFLNKDCIIESKDKYWLGNGMYFWDNHGNALYWAKQKKRKDCLAKVCIVKANIIIDQLLDLTDNDVIDTINDIWNNYCCRKRINSDRPLGIKLNTLFDFFSDFNDKYKVIKAVGYYKDHKLHNFFIDSNVSSQIKTIYCVKSSNKISDKSKFQEI